MLGHLGAQPGQLGGLQARGWAPALPRRQVLPGTMQAEHLFDKSDADIKETGDFTAREFPLLDGRHDTDS